MKDEFYLADLIGLAGRGADGTPLGRVKSVQNFGAGDLVEIAPSAGPTFWLPFTKEAVPELNIAAGWITAPPPETE